MLTISREPDQEGVVICRAIGELDAFTVPEFRQALAQMATTHRFAIDLSGVTFIDSAGLGALIGGIRRTREFGGNATVACNRKPLRALLQATGFDRIVTVTPEIDEAVQALHPVAGQAGPEAPHAGRAVPHAGAA